MQINGVSPYRPRRASADRPSDDPQAGRTEDSPSRAASADDPVLEGELVDDRGAPYAAHDGPGFSRFADHESLPARARQALAAYAALSLLGRSGRHFDAYA